MKKRKKIPHALYIGKGHFQWWEGNPCSGPIYSQIIGHPLMHAVYFTAMSIICIDNLLDLINVYPLLVHAVMLHTVA